MADNFRTVIGIIQFEPKEGEAGGKTVRNIVVRQTGFKEQNVKVSATVWPSHAHVQLEEGTVVAMEGKFDVRKGTNKDGDPVTYNNLSVSRLAVLGQADPGKKESDSGSSSSDAGDDDDIPF